MQLQQGRHKYGWLASSFPYPISVMSFNHMICDLLNSGVTVTCWNTNESVIVVTWKKPWEVPNAVDAQAS